MTAPVRIGEPIVVDVALAARGYSIVIGRGQLLTLGQRIAALRGELALTSGVAGSKLEISLPLSQDMLFWKRLDAEHSRG